MNMTENIINITPTININGDYDIIENIINITTTTNINVGTDLSSCPWSSKPPCHIFIFLVEELSEAGQMSQPVRACKPGMGDLSKPTAPAYYQLMFVVVV